MECPVTTWTWADPRIAAPRQALTDRAGRWVTVQVGRYGRSVDEAAGELGCACHTVNDALVSYGEAIVEDIDRIGTVTALGLDEALFCRMGPYRIPAWSTSIVGVAHGRLLDLVEGRTAPGPCRRLAAEERSGWPPSPTRAAWKPSAPWAGRLGRRRRDRDGVDKRRRPLLASVVPHLTDVGLAVGLLSPDPSRCTELL